MKKLILSLLLVTSVISLAIDERIYIDEMPYIKELIEIADVQKFNYRNSEKDDIKYITEGINEELTPEVEKRILQIPEKNIIFKSYVFGKETIRVRVLYLKPFLDPSEERD